MDKLSGLLLDHYDDIGGACIPSIFPSKDTLPELVKQASYLSQMEREALPDDLFALVLQDGDVTLRKYACIDAGNTILSIGYFLENGHKLPEDAQKVAAENLKIACGWYDLQAPEELDKVAFGAFLGKGLSALGKAGLGTAKWVAEKPLQRGLPLAMAGMATVAAGKQIGDNMRQVKEHEANQGFGNIGQFGG